MDKSWIREFDLTDVRFWLTTNNRARGILNALRGSLRRMPGTSSRQLERVFTLMGVSNTGGHYGSTRSLSKGKGPRKGAGEDSEKQGSVGAGYTAYRSTWLAERSRGGRREHQHHCNCIGRPDRWAGQAGRDHCRAARCCWLVLNLYVSRPTEKQRMRLRLRKRKGRKKASEGEKKHHE